MVAPALVRCYENSANPSDSPLETESVCGFDVETGQFFSKSFAEELDLVRQLRSEEGVEPAELVLKSYQCLAGMPTYWAWLIDDEKSAPELDPQLNKIEQAGVFGLV